MFLHGYAAASCIYFSLFPYVHDAFCTIFVDIIGMGSSSRPDDFDRENFTPEQAIDYFTGYVEKWRNSFSKRVKKELTKFVLIGHSFGGFIAGHYAIKYP